MIVGDPGACGDPRKARFPRSGRPHRPSLSGSMQTGRWRWALAAMRKALTMAAGRAHWERTYTDRTVDQVSWYEPQPRRSLALIEATKLGHDAGILDVGGGASSLAARLVGLGYSDLTVADIAPAALAHARPRSAATRHASPGSRPTSAATISAVGMTCGTIVPCSTSWSSRRIGRATSTCCARRCDQAATSSSRPSGRKDPPNAAASRSSATAQRTCNGSSATASNSYRPRSAITVRPPGAANSSTTRTCGSGQTPTLPDWSAVTAGVRQERSQRSSRTSRS